MVTRSRFSTRTVVDSKYLVPWLAAEGPLAYSSAEPPAKDSFFQYTWILHEIFDQCVNLREHRYFGSPLNYRARFLFDFWNNVRSGGGAARCNDTVNSGSFRSGKSARSWRPITTSASPMTRRASCSFSTEAISGFHRRISHSSRPARWSSIEASVRRAFSGNCVSGLMRSGLQIARVWRKYLALQADMLAAHHGGRANCAHGRAGRQLANVSFGLIRVPYAYFSYVLTHLANVREHLRTSAEIGPAHHRINAG